MMVSYKKCSRCNETKSIADFGKDKYKKDGVTSDCKACRNKINHLDKNRQRRKSYKQNNKEKVSASAKEYYRNNITKVQEKNTKWYEQNRAKHNGLTKTWRAANKDYCKALAAKYFQENKASINHRNRERINKNYLLRLRRNISGLISQSLKRYGVFKSSTSVEILGCSIVEFREHIEKQFKNGMSWDNYGKWHLDHKYPTSLAASEDEILKLNHYTNYQPLWAVENIRKSNKIIA